MLRHIDSCDLEVTKETVDDLLSRHQIFAGDRDEKQHRAKHLADDMAHGKWIPYLANITFVKYLGLSYRVNGQHILKALKQEIVPDDFILRVSALTYVAENIEDVKRLWICIDDRMGARRPPDITKCSQIGTPLEGKNVGLVHRCISAIYSILMEGSKSLWDDIKKRRFAFEKYEYEILFIEDFMEPFERNSKYMRMPIIATVMKTFQVDEKLAREFWMPVFSGVGFEPNSPKKQLYDWLNFGETKSTKSNQIAKEIYTRCIRAWNAWRTGKSTNLRWEKDGDLPTIIGK